MAENTEINLEGVFTVRFVILLVTVLITVFAAISFKDTVTRKDTRVERIESMMHYTSYSYGQYSVDENMTIRELKEFYNMIPYQGYKKTFTDMALNCVCDGNCKGMEGFLR